MPYISVDVSVEKIEEEIEEYIRGLSEDVLSKALSNILYHDKYVFGWLYHNSAVIRVSGVEYEVAFYCPYASVVEFGRSAGAKMPPLDAITMWLMGKFGYDLDVSKRLAFPVSKAISKYGIAPFPFLRMAVNDVFEDTIFTGKESWDEVDEEGGESENE